MLHLSPSEPCATDGQLMRFTNVSPALHFFPTLIGFISLLSWSDW